MAIREISFASHNGRDTVKGWVYTPIRSPRAVVQIVHGFGEHSRRYLHMIMRMLDADFVVCADDHVAHGKTAFDSDTWGDPGNKGFLTTIEDEHTLHGMMAAEYPDLPYFLFGHSWGSMIARGYSALYGQELRGVVYCGTLSCLEVMPALSEKLQKAMADGKATQSGAEYIGMLFAGMTDRYPNPNGPSDWIALDADVVTDHGKDPFNNLKNPPTVHLVHDLVSLYNFIEADDWAGKVPRSLPVYLIAGDQDPVGRYGEGVYHVANMLADQGHRDVVTKIYSGYRHEIHNEPPIRDEVEQGIIDFIDRVLG